MRLTLALLLLLITLLPLDRSVLLAGAQGDGCGDYDTQAEAQAALDAPDADDDLGLQLDADLDGIACPDLEPGKERSIPRADELPDGLVEAEVARIVDGDTLKVRFKEGDDEGDIATVRLIGIDTPETKDPNDPVECFGAEATTRLKETLPEGRTVYLEQDISDTDRYDRKLRYVWIEGKGDGKAYLVNEMLVREGFAVVSTYPPDVAHVEHLTHAQEVATFRESGLWEECGGADTPLDEVGGAPTQAATNDMTAEERAYVDMVREELDLLADTSADLGELLGEPQFGDTEWTLDVAAGLVVYQQTYQEALLETPPSTRLADIHATRLAMLEALNSAADNYIAGFDSMNPDLITEANSKINEAAEHSQELIRLLDEFEEDPGAFASEPEPVPTQAPALITECVAFASFEEANAYYAANPIAQPYLDPNFDGRACEVFFGVDQAPAPPPQEAPPSGGGCDPSYPTVCIPPYPPDLDCGQVGFRQFTVLPPDPHGFDREGDGIGCE